MQLHKIFIGMLVVILVSFAFVLYIGEGVTIYSNTQTDTYNNTGFVRISNQYGKLNSTIYDAKAGAENASSQNPLANFIDIYFGGGLKAIKTAVVGAETVDTIIDVSVTETVGDYAIGKMVKNTAYAIVLVAFFIGILLYVIVGRERL